MKNYILISLLVFISQTSFSDDHVQVSKQATKAAKIADIMSMLVTGEEYICYSRFRLKHNIPSKTHLIYMLLEDKNTLDDQKNVCKLVMVGIMEYTGYVGLMNEPEFKSKTNISHCRLEFAKKFTKEICIQNRWF